MRQRHTLTLSVLCATLTALASGCPESHDTAPDAGCCGADARVPDGGPGPLDGGPGPLDAPSPIDAPSSIDATTPPDAPIAIDAAPGTDAPSACDGLAPAACLGAFCVPVFDDACCRECSPGGPCADCQNLEYHSCRTLDASPCLARPFCGTAPTWGCGPAAPFCDTANVYDLDSCDVTGCVPAYPSGTGDPDIATARCVPIVAASCTVACRRIAPNCPTGMTPEGDGFCYTDRCIPAFVCGR